MLIAILFVGLGFPQPHEGQLIGRLVRASHEQPLPVDSAPEPLHVATLSAFDLPLRPAESMEMAATPRSGRPVQTLAGSIAPAVNHIHDWLDPA